MKIPKGLLVLSLIAVTALSGCEVSFSSAELIHPPKTVGNEAEIQQLIEKSAGGSYMLKYPQSGNYRSAIIMEDINNDSVDEAIAFYRTQHNNPVTHMVIMRDNGSHWEICCDYKTQYSDIDCIQFADYDYDGNKEIFAGFITYTAGVNELAVFDFNTQSNEAEYVQLTEFYNTFTTGDYDRDGAWEAMLLTLGTTDTEAKATLLDYDNNRLYPKASCDLDADVTKFENVVSGMIDDKNTGVVIDGLLADSYNSQLIFYDSEESALVNTFYSCDSSTEKTHLIKSQDADSDGFIEIPQLSSCPVPKNAKSSITAPLISWNSFNAGNYQLDFDCSCLTNFDFNYSFFLPSNFRGTTTAIVSKDNKTMSIYYFENNKKGDLLLTFKVVENSSQKGIENFTTLESWGGHTYCYKIAEGELPLYIDDNTITDNFLLNNANNQNVQ